MKRIFVFMVLALATLTVSAQRVKLDQLDQIDDIFKTSSDRVKITGDLSELKGMVNLQVVEDLSQITIEGLDLDHWLTFRQTDQPEYSAKGEWENELKPQFRTTFLSAVNQQLVKRDFFLSENAKTDLVLVVQPKTMKRKGDCFLMCYLRHQGSTENLAVIGVSGFGGHFGTMANLWGDGLRSAGKALGKVLGKEIDKLK